MMSQAGHDMRTGETHLIRSGAAKDMNKFRQVRTVDQDVGDFVQKIEDTGGGVGKSISRIASYPLSDVPVLKGVLSKYPAISDVGDIPAVGLVITGVIAVIDVANGHYLDAAGAVAGFAASVAFVAGVALMATPVGWGAALVFVAAIGVGFVATELVDHYKTVEHWGLRQLLALDMAFNI